MSKHGAAPPMMARRKAENPREVLKRRASWGEAKRRVISALPLRAAIIKSEKSQDATTSELTKGSKCRKQSGRCS